MNKTLMLIICDFLLLSMLALARFDQPEELPESTLDATAPSAAAEAELIRLLEETLESEKQSRSALNKNLDQTRQNLADQELKLAEREAALAGIQKTLKEKETEVARLTETKGNIETERQKLAAEKARIETERLELAQKFESTRIKLEEVNSEQIELIQTLGLFKEQSSVSKERLNQTEKNLLAREAALSKQENELKAAQAEAQKLQQQLQVARAERILLQQTLLQEQQEKAQVLAHADRLTQNVTELGTGISQLGQDFSELMQTSEDIKKEIDVNRPRTMNEIFTRFQNNRATIRFTSVEKPLIGSPDIYYYESKSILISDPDTENTYLVTHISDTPFVFYKNPDKLQSVRLEISLSGRTYPITKIAFHQADPRILFITLPEHIVETNDLETFELASQLNRWEEAVLIKNDESNFGSAEFRRLTQSERFLKMSRPVLGEILNDFASSRGDLAFSKNNQFIGLLADEKHAVVIDAFRDAAIIDLGYDFDTTKYAPTNRLLKDRLLLLPEVVR